MFDKTKHLIRYFLYFHAIEKIYMFDNIWYFHAIKKICSIKKWYSTTFDTWLSSGIRDCSIFMAMWDQWIGYGTGCNFRPPGVQGPVLFRSKRIRGHCLFLTSLGTNTILMIHWYCWYRAMPFLSRLNHTGPVQLLVLENTIHRSPIAINLTRSLRA